ncbi:MAG TPA: hypothetical protein VK550_24630, partial [Polyangiaceae bacterium]|nr:hypothetical protein [Polyangiaceae bacterium]
MGMLLRMGLESSGREALGGGALRDRCSSTARTWRRSMVEASGANGRGAYGCPGDCPEEDWSM